VPLPIGLLDGWRGEVALTTDRLVLGDHALSDVSASISVSDGTLRIDHLTGRIGGGTLSSTWLFNSAASVPSLSVQASIAGATVASPLFSTPIDLADGDVQGNIDLTASGGFESAALGSLLTPATRVFSVSAGLTQTIFDHGALLGQYQYSKARYAELLSDYHKTVLTALGNVEDALVAVQQSTDQELRLQDAADKARRAFEYAQLQFQAGTTNVLTMLNTETALFSAQDALVQGKFAHTQALLTLYQALGGGWHAPEPG